MDGTSLALATGETLTIAPEFEPGGESRIVVTCVGHGMVAKVHLTSKEASDAAADLVRTAGWFDGEVARRDAAAKKAQDDEVARLEAEAKAKAVHDTEPSPPPVARETGEVEGVEGVADDPEAESEKVTWEDEGGPPATEPAKPAPRPPYVPPAHDMPRTKGSRPPRG
jgi:hypothetical protein